MKAIRLLLLTLTVAAAHAGAQQAAISDPTRAGRSMAMSEHGMVASAHWLATLAGVDVLRNGGNAMDAAITTVTMLAVVEPAMTGLGGDVFVLYYEAKTGKVYALNGSGHSPMGLSREYFDTKDNPSIDTNSWESVTVPGAVDAYVTAHERFGSKPLAELLAPAIHYAEDGFPIGEVVGLVWRTQQAALRKDAWAKKTFLVGGQAPEVGSIFKLPYLAKTLRGIAEGGRDYFYEGPAAEAIVAYSEETGGFFSLDDFKNHHSEWVEPINTDYRGYTVWQHPPNGQGVAVLSMLNILEGFDLPSMKFNTPEYLHLLIEAKKLAYADVYKFVADPATADIPVEKLLSKEYAAERRKLIDPNKAMDVIEPGFPKNGDTTVFVTVDQEGNAVSFINSLFGPFGSGIVGGESGVMLQNRGEGFTLEKGHVNEYAPGKRPFHTIIPGLVTKDGKLYMTYGLMGGDMQPQGHVQFLLAHLDHGLTIQEAADVPRWRHSSGLDVKIEPGTLENVEEGLEALGHDVGRAAFVLVGGAQAIMVNPETGVYMGASDPRKDGIALGW